MVRIEYDDGKQAGKDSVRQCTPRGRACGFYAVTSKGERRIPISFMKVGEMAGLEKLLNELIEECGQGGNGVHAGLRSQ